MNYGKFFRLNQNISKIEDGVAIYDYIDLPAYFESSESNKMSPKYPISVTITDTIVRFRIHYSTYKIETQSNEGNHTDYQYDVEKTYNKDNQSQTTLTTLKHKEQVVFELPYASDSTDQLYQAIKDIYITRYPLVEKTDNDRSSTKQKKQTFINALIQKRYKKGLEGGYKNDLEKQMYEKLQDSLDGDFSYSTLWLMDIVECDDNGKKNINLEGKEGQKKDVLKFLRKLLLDFMFDLKHSDVFQTSKYYDSMFSGLMSNFYFSALMHKCEYYFYRGMITDIINNKRIKKPETEREHIGKLYAKQLVDAEALWIHDIMSPSAEKYFEHYNQNDTSRIKTIVESTKNIWNPYRFVVWNSWFAKPEEEMRRVCFTMKEINGEEHICNVETIVEYLQSAKDKKEKQNQLMKQLIIEKDNFRVTISQWFLKRFDFVDVLHLHTFKYANWILFTAMVLILGLLFFIPQSITQLFWNDHLYYLFGCLVLTITICCIFGVSLLVKKPSTENILKYERKKLVYRRTIAVLLMAFLVAGILWGFPNLVSDTDWQKCMNEVSIKGTLAKISYIVVQIILIACGGILINRFFHLNWLANMHLFYPRLVASIATAWLSLAIGNELFGSFFDSIVSWSTSIWLTVIVFIFVMYEINKMLPFDRIRNKLSRCFGILIISYMISLIVGLFIINFTGERFLERSGVLEDFYQDYVDNNVSKQVENRRYKLITYPSETLSNSCIDSLVSIIIVSTNSWDPVVNNGDCGGKLLFVEKKNKNQTDEELLKKLESVHIVSDSSKKTGTAPNHPIVTTWDLGYSKFFILRDFLIQFAFVAMFIGIFITMLFEGKSITEV